MNGYVFEGDNLDIIKKIKDESFDLIYIDPPFNTGKKQKRTRISTIQDENGDRVGYGGKKYSSEKISTTFFEDQFDDYLEFLKLRLEESYRILKKDGSFFLHLDYREVHYAKVLLDFIFGRENFINEIIWSYDYGARSKNKWPTKHDNILFYAKNKNKYTFNYDKIDRIPYLAPSLVGEEKTKRGKTPTDVWWNTVIVNSKEKLGYVTQKPLNILDRIISVHTNPGDFVLDFFAGSGTTGEAALKNKCKFMLIDNNKDAILVMKKRFEGKGVKYG